MLFDIRNWYWIVGGNGPHIANAGDPFTGDETRVYSSKRAAYVPASDPTYVAWLAGDLVPTRIDTEANLIEVLTSEGLPTGPLRR